MAEIIETHKQFTATGDRELYIYNGLDCCVTAEVHAAIAPQLDEHSRRVYSFERAMQGPALDMMMLGIAVDVVQRGVMINELENERLRLQHVLDVMAYAVWDAPLNANSPKQVGQFFYDIMHLPAQTLHGKRTTNRDALEKLSNHFYPRPIIATILALRDNSKKLAVLRSGIDSDNRLRCSYGVASTETGRWVSYKNVRGTGTNLQNITDAMRRVFVADPGHKLAYIDLEQAESRVVGLIAWLITGLSNYLDACESGDLHTSVARMVWPGLPWTGDLKHDRKIADEIFYRHFSYRDMSKRGGHGTNYYGKPHTMAKHLHVRPVLMEDFQHSYFRAFPEIPMWHTWVSERIQLDRYLITPLGRRRYFFGRPWDDATLREAIAFMPQSFVGDLLNFILLRVWQSNLPIKILLQVHDAICIQYKEEMEDEIIPQVLSLFRVPLHYPSRDFSIPAEASVGWNWAKFNDNPKKGRINVDGLKKFKGHDTRQREYRTDVPLLNRRVS